MDYKASTKFYYEFFYRHNIVGDDHERYQVIFELIAELCNGQISKISKVLDVGCGPGIITNYLRQMIPAVFSTDIIKTNMFDARSSSNHNVCFAQSALPRLPFSDSAFDLIVFSEVIEHLQKGDQIASIKEIARVVRRGAWVILSTPNPTGINGLTETIYAWYQTLRHREKILPKRGGQLIENWIRPHKLRSYLKMYFKITVSLGSCYVPFWLPKPLNYGIKLLVPISHWCREQRFATRLGLYQYYLLQRL